MRFGNSLLAGRLIDLMRIAVRSVLLFWVGWVSSWAGTGWDSLGPLYDESPLTLRDGRRIEALGPLFSLDRAESETTMALPPLLSTRRDPSTDFTDFDFLYPVLTYDRFGLEYRVQLLQWFSFSGGATMEETGKRRLTLFPFYFHQRSPDPSMNYTALVPIYGHLQNRFFRDEIHFVLLPAYLRTRKRDVVTDNYLAPFFHRRRGDGLQGWQFWPLLGREHKEITTRTNQYGETELVGGHEKLFALWPFYIRNDLGLGTTNTQTQRLFLPFYSAQRSPARDTTSYLWPLGFTHTVDREKQYREWAAPWPFIDFARGEGKTLNRVWPLFSHGRTPSFQSSFYLWPVYRSTRLTAESLDRRRTRVLLFLYTDVSERNTAAETVLERRDLWPLFTARRDHNGNKRLQVLAPLEPLLPGNRAVERNYSPLWSVWRSEKNAQTGRASQSLLWNLYRRESEPDAKKSSLLFGLFQYQTGTEGNRWRLFYIPVGGNRKSDKAPGKEQPPGA